MADLKTNLLGFVMNSPVIGASGTVGYGVEYEELADFAKIGGISGKGLTLHGQYGNKGERLWETLLEHSQRRRHLELYVYLGNGRREHGV